MDMSKSYSHILAKNNFNFKKVYEEAEVSKITSITNIRRQRFIGRMPRNENINDCRIVTSWKFWEAIAL